MDRIFWTLQEVASTTRVSPRTVHRWVRDGRLATYKPGKERLVRVTDLEAFLASVKDAPGRRGQGPASRRSR